MDIEKIIATLKEALVYVEGAYECAFPDESENQRIQQDVENLIEELEYEKNYITAR